MTAQPRQFMAHPKRRDDVRLVLEAVLAFLIVCAVVAVGSVSLAPVPS